MRLEDLNWFDVQSYLKTDDRLMLVLGSCEQHGFLSLLTDVKIPLALADAAGQETNVLVAPPLNFGCSPYFMGYPGTLSLRASTLLDLIEDLVRSAYRHGFRRMLILNGHGGNDAARARLYEVAGDFPDLRLARLVAIEFRAGGCRTARAEARPCQLVGGIFFCPGE
jgi:creatinine amidohydrolase